MEAQALKKLGEKIEDEVKRREAEGHRDSVFTYIDVLAGREQFGLKATRRVKVLRHVVAAQGLGGIRRHGLLDVIRSYYAVNGPRGSDPARSMQETLHVALEASQRDGDPHEIRVPKLGNGHYTLTIVPEGGLEARPPVVTTPAKRLVAEADEPLTRLFWHDYLEEGTTSEIAYGLPLFTRSGPRREKIYTRRVAVNRPSEAPGEDISWAFVTLGDMLCMHHVMGWLQSRRVPLSTRAYDHTSTFEDFRKQVDNSANVFVVGSPRVCGLIREYQGVLEHDPPRRRLPFQVGLHEVVNGNRNPPLTLCERDLEDGIVEAPVVVTRRPGDIAGAVTMVAANLGKAVERVGEVLTDERLLTALFITHPQLKTWRAGALPSCFQVLLLVRVHARDKLNTLPVVEDVWVEPADRLSRSSPG